jgi:phosphoribosylformylglycinamidine synthase
MYTAEIIIMPLKELLDPQGKAVEHGLKNMSYSGLTNIRIGKFITIEVEAASEKEANEKVEEACKKLLANPVIEGYRFTIKAQ